MRITVDYEEHTYIYRYVFKACYVYMSLDIEKKI